MRPTPHISYHRSERGLTHNRASIGLLWLLFTSLAYASGLPSGYPDEFQRYGTIERIDIVKRAAVIGDNYYRLSKQIAIHSPSLYNVGIHGLRKGRKCGFSVSVVGSGIPLITELWILPVNYELPRDMMMSPPKKID